MWQRVQLVLAFARAARLDGGKRQRRVLRLQRQVALADGLVAVCALLHRTRRHFDSQLKQQRDAFSQLTYARSDVAQLAAAGTICSCGYLKDLVNLVDMLDHDMATDGYSGAEDQFGASRAKGTGTHG